MRSHGGGNYSISQREVRNLLSCLVTKIINRQSAAFSDPGIYRCTKQMRRIFQRHSYPFLRNRRLHKHSLSIISYIFLDFERFFNTFAPLVSYPTSFWILRDFLIHLKLLEVFIDFNENNNFDKHGNVFHR